MIQFFETSVDELEALSAQLVHDHKNDLCAFGEDVDLKIHWGYYKHLETMDMVRVYCATEFGILFGYFGAVISAHQHYQDHVVADCDAMYVAKDYRDGLLGYKFLKWCLNKLENEPRVKSILFGTKAHFDVGKLLDRLGYKPIETIYHKRVG